MVKPDTAVNGEADTLLCEPTGAAILVEARRRPATVCRRSVQALMRPNRPASAATAVCASARSMTSWSSP